MCGYGKTKGKRDINQYELKTDGDDVVVRLIKGLIWKETVGIVMMIEKKNTK